MRYYNLDGTYREVPGDVGFGWYLSDIAIDEAQVNYRRHNTEMRKMSRMELIEARNMKKTPADDPDEVAKRQNIILIKPNIHEETPISVEYCIDIKNSKMDNASYIRSIDIPSKEQMIRLINPVNPEMKSLLNVISTCRYNALKDEVTKKSIFNNINYRATHSNKLLNDSGVLREFRLNGDHKNNRIEEMADYNVNNEDNMISLMMELINTDLGSTLGDISDNNTDTNEASSSTASNHGQSSSTPIKILQDQMRRLLNKKLKSLGVSYDLDSTLSDICASEPSPDNYRSKERKDNIPWPMSKSKTDLLNSIGFTEDLNKSIQIFTEDKDEIQQQLDDIKDSFQEAEEKVENLIQETGNLTNDLRETAFLDNLIHLLNGDLEKVKLRSLPFKIFFEDDDADFHHNMVI